MNDGVLRIQKVRENGIVPKRATTGSAGMDLHAAIDTEITLATGETAFVPTGIAIGLPSEHYAGFVFARSGLAVKHGIGLLNSVGVIDSDYTGEIGIGLINQKSETYTIKPNERIAQLVILPVALPEIEEVETLTQTQRGDGGFGSTGK